ncbi:MAG: PqqD family protein [Ignavibacteria bacterium]|jgi:hypothetical protein|nr:PqqD family protein [Ignavibacteria bacterium]MDH7528435.1 PqqD family protein [Ignavibacteria bacterium]
MISFKRKSKEKVEVNLWELIPIRKFDFEKSENNLITILIPKFTNKFLVRHLMPRLKYPFFKVKLDEIGSAVWLEIDGKKKVGEIAQILEEKFGAKIQPIEERLSKFFTQLQFHQFIDFKNEES